MSGIVLYYAEVLMPRKVCAAARYLDLPVEYVHLSLAKGEHKRPDYLAIHPLGKVPALKHGARIVWESDAILVVLAQLAGSALWPSRGEDQVDVLRWLAWNAHALTPPCGKIYFEHVIKTKFALGAADAAQVAEGQQEFRAAAPLLEQHLAQRDWLVGGAPTVADFSLANPLAYADAAPFPLAEFPAIRRWHDRLMQWDAWRNPFPAR